MMRSRTGLCCLVGCFMLLLQTASAFSKHEEAPIIGINGTFNTHFSANIRDLDPGECLIFEAQAQMAVKDGELCLSAAGVKMTGVTIDGSHPLDAGRLLPKGCKRRGLRIAEVVSDDTKSCFLKAARQIDNPANVLDDCKEQSPYAYQFIDPTRHDPLYLRDKGPDPIAKLCTLLLEATPVKGTRVSDDTIAVLKRHNHHEFEGRCLKSVTYVVANACDDPIKAMLFEGESDHCIRNQKVTDGAFKTCTKAMGGQYNTSALIELLSGILFTAVIGCLAAAAAVIFLRKRREDEQRRAQFGSGDNMELGLTEGKLSSSAPDPDGEPLDTPSTSVESAEADGPSEKAEKSDGSPLRPKETSSGL